jgi:urocanate hydratase
MVGLFDNPDDWEVAAQMGVSSYGQMTAGGWMYIGPQGIVHGTYNTLLGAGRKMCGVPADGDLAGLLFVSSGLGGMSGAQPKAAEISGAVSVIAEVDRSRIDTRHRQGWVNMVSADLAEVVAAALKARDEKRPLSVAYHGNVVDLLQYLVDHKIPVDLLSDQTSCHVVYDGGYCPQGLSFEGTHPDADRGPSGVPAAGGRQPENAYRPDPDADPAGRVFFRLRQRLFEGRFRRRGDRCGPQRPGREGRLRLSVLFRGYHGAHLRLWIRPLSVGVPQR